VRFETICVVGLGYIGLPTASTFATHGLKVLGVDVDRRVLDALGSGEVHIHEPGLRALVRTALGSGNLTISQSPSAADAFILAVPTPLQTSDGARADMRYVAAAAESIAPHLRPGNLVVLESTSPPRTTVDFLAPLLERSGLRAGSDFFLAYSPERVLPGQILRELIENARVIGGIDRASAEAGRELYAAFAQGEILLTDATTAEMVKLMENTFRDVNIALANEFARLAEGLGVDVWQAIGLANRHPRVAILRPGPGVGGHCISVDPWFLVSAAPEVTPLIQAARRVNDEQPRRVAQLVEGALRGVAGRRIAALGLAYKAEVDDLRESPAISVVQRLAERSARVSAFDPYTPGAEVEGVRVVTTLEEALHQAEAVLLLVDHARFRALDPADAAASMTGRLAFDARGVWSAERWAAAGFDLRVLGTPSAHE
jgi:UDP-N-acetyl-D-mannosaminuronic acid dehydrogenase